MPAHLPARGRARDRRGLQLHDRERYRQLFGDPGAPYPTSYKPRPESRDFVINLSNWYAQGHPVEDFAETFAIWLNPHIDWRSDYARWPALEKLEYVDDADARGGRQGAASLPTRASSSL